MVFCDDDDNDDAAAAADDDDDGCLWCIRNDEITRRFNELDRDRNGVLSPDEVIAVIRDTMGYDQQRAVSLVLHCIALLHYAITTYYYYIALYYITLHWITLHQRAVSLIQIFDQNQDGNLDKTEFMHLWAGIFG